ncbi:MAG: gfo/Idh/MocA family oxidoreductase [Candidatus Latescibacteria bacterium]|nr:gfo/Idh/MocA family oxidoreductase [Candidatus Latescibacterota bacterium]
MSPKKQKKLRVGIIGAGGIAGAHMRYYAQMDDVELVALADISEAAMAAKAEEYGVESCYTDYKKMLKEAQPDAVSVCTPNGLHAPNSIAALNAGAHVLVEKPMAMNARQCKAMLAAAEKNKRKLVIAFQHRFEPETQFIKKQVDAGYLGEIKFARVQALRRRGIPNWGVFGRKDLQGGGPLIDIGVHALEMTHYAMGSPTPVAASGQTFTYLGDKPSDVLSQWPNWDYKNYTVEDLAIGQIRFENGAVLHLESSFAAHIPNSVMTFELMGEKGGARKSPVGIFRDDNGYMVNTQPDWLPSGDAADCFGIKMREFVAHALNDEPTRAPGEHGMMVQKMLDGIYASAEKGREVRIS